MFVIGIPVLILGESGSGKSASCRNFENKDVGILNVASKPLPFRKKLPVINNANYNTIASALRNPSKKSYVIDDSQYLMAFELFDKASVKGYDKFTELAVNFANLIKFIINNTPNDVIVYFLHHTENDEFGKTKAKTIGKMLDQQLTVEGLFSIVLKTEISDGQYKFITQNNGNNTCKSPIEMFDLEIDNDLKFVDTTIREYYEITNKNNDKVEEN